MIRGYDQDFRMIRSRIIIFFRTLHVHMYDLTDRLQVTLSKRGLSVCLYRYGTEI